MISSWVILSNIPIPGSAAGVKNYCLGTLVSLLGIDFSTVINIQATNLGNQERHQEVDIYMQKENYLEVTCTDHQNYSIKNYDSNTANKIKEYSVIQRRYYLTFCLSVSLSVKWGNDPNNTGDYEDQMKLPK